MEHLLTTEEIADYLRVDVVTVRRLVTRGELPAYRIGGEFRFMAPDIETFVRSQRVTTSGSGESTFEKFTERARKVFAFANEEAHELDHHYIGTEHLLLGIVREGEGVAALALMQSGLDLQDVRESVLKKINPPEQPAPESAKALFKGMIEEARKGKRTNPYDNPFGGQTLTRRVKKVIELAVDEARRLKHHYIGTEHLLLAILFEGEGLAAQVLLGEYRLQLPAIRELVLQILQKTSTMTLPEIPEQAATLLGEHEQGVKCGRCGAQSPEYFRFCFHCGLKI